ncbi:P-loop containing nucleoside triphosphate hydrolase protein [Cytidiella melzeri]|nr:P-loop containing nucleoside triphosphate hydrolase protein [Cytidiella melzeri]
MAIPTAGEATDEDPTGAADSTKGAAGDQEDEDEVPSGDPGTVLQVKLLDEVLNTSTGKWDVKPTPAGGHTGPPTKKGNKYQCFAFTVVRRFTPAAAVDRTGKVPSYTIAKFVEIHSDELRKIGGEVIGPVQGGVSWTAKPLRVTPQLLLSWLSELTAHLATLEESSVSFAHLSHLLDWLNTEYGETLETLASLLEHSEITFDLLWAILVPNKTVLQIPCPLTQEPRAVRLINAENVEYLETDVSTKGVQFGYARLGNVIDIPGFSGTQSISTLGVYPMKYYAGPDGHEGLKTRLIARGKRWADFAGGVNHLAYKGVAYIWRRGSTGSYDAVKTSVDSRVMIDRKAFEDNIPNYDKMSQVTKTLKGVEIDRFSMRTTTAITSQDKLGKLEDLTDDDLMLSPPTLYGFSLSDKQWLEFSVDTINKFDWSEEAYQNLVIPAEQKSVLTTLVEAHSSGPAAYMDDFIQGKGLGLVINLYGNPGTGKSLTAEAMKPLYVIGAGDLGTTASKIDASLNSVLKISATWGAVVLIDEADVFLEERALHHIERNAMVAVFLRHLEYFRGILFLTTNRVRVFDEAFQSRIHVSLLYHDLNAESRRKIWVAFLHKVHGDDIPDGGLSKEELRQLGEKKINGRQIKNVVKTATALASGRQQQLGYRHLVQVLEMMEQFDAR